MELWALRYGLKMSLNLNFCLIEVEIDVNVDVEWAVGHPSSSISLKISRYGLQELPQSNTAGEN